MTTNELNILGIIWNYGGEAAIDIIARNAGLSIDYARVICKKLHDDGYINFLNSKLCKITDKGKKLISKSVGQRPLRTVIPDDMTNIKGKSILNYG